MGCPARRGQTLPTAAAECPLCVLAATAGLHDRERAEHQREREGEDRVADGEARPLPGDDERDGQRQDGREPERDGGPGAAIASYRGGQRLRAGLSGRSLRRPRSG